jgi:hypothetical protein
MRNRGSPFSNSGAIDHGDDLKELLDRHGPDVKDVLASTDGGGDVSMENFRVQFVLGERFMSGQYGTFAQVSHAPGQSYRHYIERFFCFLNNVDGVEISPHLPGETHPPNQQSDLTPEQIKLKERELFDGIFPFINNSWNSLKIKGYTIHSESVYNNEVRFISVSKRFKFDPLYHRMR